MDDIQTFEENVEKIQSAIYMYCFKKLNKNKYMTDEAVSLTLNVLYKKWNTLDKNGNIKAYAYRVADNCILQVKESSDRYYSHNESLEAIAVNGSDEGFVCTDRYFCEDDGGTDQYIERITAMLPSEYTQLFVYRYIEKCSIKEIMGLTGLRYSSLRLRLLKIESIIKTEIKKIFN